MKLYRGIRTMPGYYPVVFVDEKVLDINASKTAVYDHGADRPEWGYGGQGPSQLSAAILYDLTGNAEVAKQHYRQFTRDFIATFDEHGFILLETQVRTWLDKQLRNTEEQ